MSNKFHFKKGRSHVKIYLMQYKNLINRKNYIYYLIKVGELKMSSLETQNDKKTYDDIPLEVINLLFRNANYSYI